MGVAKITLDGETLIDLTSDTIKASTLMKGSTAHDAKGDLITGELESGGAIIEREDNTGGGLTITIDNASEDDGGASLAEYIEGDAGANITSLPDNITSIGTAAFAMHYNMALTSLPSKVTSIGDYAFQHCRRLALTKLPDGITSIGKDAFYYCTNLALTSLPSGLTSIDSYAFYYCLNLEFTSLPSGLTSIDGYAFGRCSRLTSLTFKGTLTSIASTAFSSCTNLKDIYVPWAEGAVADAPWGATNATITYNYTSEA